MSIYENAQRNIDRRKSEAELIASDMLALAMRDEEFAKLQKQAMKATPLIAKARVEGDLETEKKLILSVNRIKFKQVEILKRMKINPQSFYPKYTCPECRDTGYLKSGEACKCLRQEVLMLMLDECGLSKRTLHNFSDSNPKIFNADDRERLKKIYSKMQDFCSQFPNVKLHNLLFTGASGCGKTFLIECIASNLMQRGYTVLFATAFEINNIFLRYHTTFREDKNMFLDNLLKCDVLIIDDLGTEPIYKNVTIEYLYSILSERTLTKKTTIISTNLDINDLQKRYDEKIASRIYDKQSTYTIALNTSNLRHVKSE